MEYDSENEGRTRGSVNSAIPSCIPCIFQRIFNLYNFICIILGPPESVYVDSIYIIYSMYASRARKRLCGVIDRVPGDDRRSMTAEIVERGV